MDLQGRQPIARRGRVHKGNLCAGDLRTQCKVQGLELTAESRASPHQEAAGCTGSLEQGVQGEGEDWSPLQKQSQVFLFFSFYSIQASSCRLPSPVSLFCCMLNFAKPIR